MTAPLISIPLPGPYFKLDMIPLTGIYLFSVLMDYYLLCCVKNNQQIKYWLILYHLLLPVVFSPKIHLLSFQFISYPWFIVAMGLYSSNLYKQRYKNEKIVKPQPFQDWIVSIFYEGLVDSSQDKSVSKSKIRMEGVKKLIIDIVVIKLSSEVLNIFLLPDPKEYLNMNWYSVRTTFYGAVYAMKTYNILSTKDVGLDVIQIVTGVRIIKAFNYPFLATSPLDVWSHRWNMIVRNILHKLIFTSNINISKKFKGLLTFLSSGLMHELFMAIINRQITFEQFAFFIIQGVIVMLQLQFVPKSIFQGNKVPKLLLIIMTLYITSLFFQIFYAPIYRFKEQAILYYKQN